MRTSKFWKYLSFVPGIALGYLLGAWVDELWRALVLVAIALCWVFCAAMYASLGVHEDWERYDDARHRAGIV